jgi:hypothetical protein
MYYILTKEIDYGYGESWSHNVAISASIDALKAKAVEDPKVFDQVWEDSQNGYLIMEVNHELAYQIEKIEKIEEL